MSGEKPEKYQYSLEKKNRHLRKHTASRRLSKPDIDPVTAPTTAAAATAFLTLIALTPQAGLNTCLGFPEATRWVCAFPDERRGRLAAAGPPLAGADASESGFGTELYNNAVRQLGGDGDSWSIVVRRVLLGTYSAD